MACSSLTSVAVKMAADLERMPLRIAELEIPDHEFDEYVGGVKRYRPAVESNQKSAGGTGHQAGTEACCQRDGIGLCSGPA